MGGFPIKFCCVKSGIADLGYEDPVSTLLLAFPGQQKGGVQVDFAQTRYSATGHTHTHTHMLCSCVLKDKEQRKVNKQSVLSLTLWHVTGEINCLFSFLIQSV